MSGSAATCDSEVSGYLAELGKAMNLLEGDLTTVFVGQSVAYDGQAMHASLANVPHARRIEMPVAEDFQMGFSIGLALEGLVPVCIYPRWDFLLLAANQLVNHLDKLPLFSGYEPKLIIRVAVGSRDRFNAGPQHSQNLSKAFAAMLSSVAVIEMRSAAAILPAYRKALADDHSTILVEFMDLYRD
jgi:pyruvate/2-oxoglutarate/acetoin dehydrogenase E1 component